ELIKRHETPVLTVVASEVISDVDAA
ncbi:MAG: hypothetical protein RJB28_546, partial [Actinomycetota bacterium]